MIMQMMPWLPNSIVAHLWQMTLLFLLVYAISKFRGNQAKHLTLLLWVVFFLKCITPPVITSPTGLLAWATPQNLQSSALLDDSATSAHRPVEADSKSKLHKPMPPSSEAQGKAAITTNLSGNWISSGLLVWGIGTLAYLAFSMISYFLLLRRMIPAEAPLVSENSQFASKAKEATRLIHQYQKSLDGARQVRLRMIDLDVSPFSCGLLQPTIVVPLAYLKSEASLEPVVAHELCHLWRRDHLVGWLQLFVQAIFWFHPCVWLASRQTNYWCELCCDEDAIRMFELQRSTYLKGLLEVVSVNTGRKNLNWLPAMSPFEVTRSRMEAVLNKTRSGSFRQNQAPVILLLLLFVLPANIHGGLYESGNADDTVNSAVATLNPELNFLAGKWKVISNGKDGIADSEFKFEKSGRMIREEWTSVDGSSAQGITYFDPASQQWKMTFGGSDGTVMELAGRLESNVLEMRGTATSKSGDVFAYTLRFIFSEEEQFQLAAFVGEVGVRKKISELVYVRRK